MRRTPILLHAALVILAGAGPAMAADPSCQPVLNALAKLRTVPYHMTMTETGGAAAALNGGKPDGGETISTGEKMYVRVGGEWHVTDNPMHDADDAEEEEAQKLSCTFLREEGGDAVWAVRSQSEDDQSQGQIWIAKAAGLLQRQETDQDVGGGDMGKSHLSVRLDYTDVEPPPGM